MPETWNLARKYKDKLGSGNIPFSARTPNIAEISICFWEKQAFLGKNKAFFWNKYVSCGKDFLVLFSVFLDKKSLLMKKYQPWTMHPESISSISPN